MGFPVKNDHFGVFWGYHHLRKQPYIYHLFFWGGLEFKFWTPESSFRDSSPVDGVVAIAELPWSWPTFDVQEEPKDLQKKHSWYLEDHPTTRKYLSNNPPSISHEWPFGKGTTPGIGDET